MSELYFFKGEKRRKYKRFRKPPELLPFSVRLTGLSGAVKVEAYLKQQQQKAGDGKETPAGRNSQEVGKSRENVAEGESPSRAGILVGLLQKEAEGKRNHKRVLNLPDIGFHAPVIRSLDQLEGDDEEEDTQRFLFEENKFAAPNLLAQLARLLDHIHERQLEEFEEVRSLNSQLSHYTSRVSTPVVPEEEESVNTETLVRHGGVVVSLPDDLHHKLLWNYEQLSSGAVYVKRDWQTSSYREQAILQKRNLGNVSESNMQESSSKQHDLQKPTDYNKSGGEVDSKSPGKADAKDTKRRRSGQNETNNIPTAEGTTKQEDNVLAPGSTVSRDNHSIAELQSHSPTRRESTSTARLPFAAKPKTRLERFKNISENKRRPSSQLHMHRLSLTNQNQHIDEEEESRDLSDVHSTQNVPGQPAVINFSLLSPTCEEKGWIIHPNDANDLERQTLLEWARSRLQQVIKEKEEMQEKAKECGEDGPVVIKYYGDTQREAAMKYKKGVSWAKRWSKQYEEEKRPKFVTSIPDGTSYCYYPSGRMAVCAVNPGPMSPGKYTLVYDDAVNSPMLASFTPAGLGCCYHRAGGIRFVSTAKFGAVMLEDGKVEQKWKWPLGRLQTTVVVPLNNFITLRCSSHSLMTLYFNCQNETTKFPVGLTQGAKTVKQSELGYLRTDASFTSMAAMQSTKAKPKKKEGRRRKGQKQPKVDAITEEILEQRQQELEEKFPERKDMDLDAPWQLELTKLQRKVKGLVFEWMEHYRISVGITSPIRNTSRAQRRALAHSARSVPGTLPSYVAKGRRSLAQRSPSAPPSPCAKGLGRAGQRGSARFPARPHSSAESRGRDAGLKGVYMDVPGASRAASRLGSKAPSAMGSRSISRSLSPFRCGVVQQPRPVTPPRSGCTVALRAEFYGEKDPQCRCDRRRIPLITDLEYDAFITDHVPKTQLVVISVTSSVYPDGKLCDSMLDQLYYERNRNRSIPCIQARNDPFRLIRYDVATAASRQGCAQPLLLRRHNAVPGMFLMYIGGRLLFADHIFNGYGNAKKDFLKQITRTRKEALEGKGLPADFRLSPTRGRSGMRAAWGGEIGGVKPANSILTFSPVTESPADHTLARISSAATTESSATIEIRGGTHSSTSFVSLGLSIDSPYPRLPTTRRSGNEVQNIQSAA